ncbi:carbonic anhydrase [Streptomyces sp. NBC_01014]|uniref:carbonic anhydrase n=1 Tax=Streptomyces sp. NBC_01014 TaxID=2903719 RepID=UPI00386A26DF|nr:carbonic anhydrase [Streptomyces sp. NBC_01014]
MHDLAEGVARFQHDVFPAKAELFTHLAGTHRPTTLFISCSDARVVPELITQSEPGELFVIRTAGNLVPAHAPGPDGVAASIEYAVAVLGVSEIVVCGHSACGAMTALAEQHDLTGLPAVADWLRHADASRARATAANGAMDAAALVRENVRAQLVNLATHPSVARALAERTLSLHGWVYDIPAGTVEVLDPAGPPPAMGATDSAGFTDSTGFTDSLGHPAALAA